MICLKCVHIYVIKSIYPTKDIFHKRIEFSLKLSGYWSFQVCYINNSISHRQLSSKKQFWYWNWSRPISWGIHSISRVNRISIQIQKFVNASKIQFNYCQTDTWKFVTSLLPSGGEYQNLWIFGDFRLPAIASHRVQSQMTPWEKHSCIFYNYVPSHAIKCLCQVGAGLVK